MIETLMMLASLFVFQQRDAATNTSDTAIVTGVVMTTDAPPTPVRRAVVSVTGPARRSAITDDQGRFMIASLPPGTVNVTAAKAAFITTAYGAARPGGAGTSIVLSAGQTMDVALAMARGGVIAGAISDDRGVPMAGASVTAVNVETAVSGSSVSPSVTLTDDHGGYRIFGLLPGDYVVAASARIQGAGNVTIPSESDVDALLAELARRRDGGASMPGTPRQDPLLPSPQTGGIVPTYFPGTAVFSQATTILVNAGDVRDGLNFSVGVVPAGTIAGTISGDPATIGATILSISPDGPYISTLPGAMPVLTKVPDVSGKFEYTGVAPGRYRITARAGGRAPTPGVTSVGAGGGISTGSAPTGETMPYLFAAADVDVRGGDRAMTVLSLQPGRTFSGRVVFDGAPAPSDAGAITMQLTSGGGSWTRQEGPTRMGNALGTVPSVTIGADGAFVIAGVPPTRFLARANIPAAMASTWWLRSIVVDGHDLVDEPPDFSSGLDIKDAVVTISARHTSLGGRLLSADDTPAPGYFVVVFSADRTSWVRNGRRLKIVRPSSAGEFSFQDLPPGEYFLAALSDADGTAWQRPEFLNQVMPAAVPVTIGEGEQVRKDLKVGAKTTGKTTSGVVFEKTTPDVVFYE